MSKQQAYSIYDSAAATYRQVYLFDREAEAKRFAIQLLTQQESDITRYPDDFSLCHIGEFDSSTGKFTPADSIRVSIKFWELRAELVNKELQSDEIPTN